MRKKIKVGVVEDHDMVRQGLVKMLDEDEGIRVVFEASNGAEALEELKNKRMDVLLLDLKMPVVDGRKVLSLVKERYSNLSVIVLSAHTDKLDIMESLQLGAKAFLPKHAEFDKLLDAIYTVHNKGFYLDELVSKALIFEALNSKGSKSIEQALTQREVDIIKGVCEGKTNQQIADDLFISKRTVDGYRRKIADKTGATNTAELVLYAVRKGICKP